MPNQQKLVARIMWSKAKRFFWSRWNSNLQPNSHIVNLCCGGGVFYDISVEFGTRLRALLAVTRGMNGINSHRSSAPRQNQGHSGDDSTENATEGPPQQDPRIFGRAGKLARWNSAIRIHSAGSRSCRFISIEQRIFGFHWVPLCTRGDSFPWRRPFGDSSLAVIKRPLETKGMLIEKNILGHTYVIRMLIGWNILMDWWLLSVEY